MHWTWWVSLVAYAIGVAAQWWLPRPYGSWIPNAAWAVIVVMILIRGHQGRRAYRKKKAALKQREAELLREFPVEPAPTRRFPA